MAKETTTENPFMTVPPVMTEGWKDLMSWQMKTAQMFFDQSVKMSQTVTDYFHHSANEGLKFSQECMKTGVTVTEDYRKHLSSLSDKAFKAGH